jgi:hypothetical protein
LQIKKQTNGKYQAVITSDYFFNEMGHFWTVGVYLSIKLSDFPKSWFFIQQIQNRILAKVQNWKFSNHLQIIFNISTEIFLGNLHVPLKYMFASTQLWKRGRFCKKLKHQLELTPETETLVKHLRTEGNLSRLD